MSLRLKFNVVIVAAFAVGLALAAMFINSLSQRIARRAVEGEAAIMMAEVNATMRYTDAQVSPLLERWMRWQMPPLAIPFFAAQRSFDLLAQERPDYTLRHPADNPTNPSDRPEPWEKEIIETFRKQPGLSTLTAERTTSVGEMMSFSQPIRVSSAACLSCHSTPDAAPPAMIDVYGSANGFGWTLGSIVSGQIVSVSNRMALSRAQQPVQHHGRARRGVLGGDGGAQPAAEPFHRRPGPAHLEGSQRGQPGKP